MEPIRSLSHLAGHVRMSGTKKILAVALAEDTNTIGAVGRAVSEGFVNALMIGNEEKIREVASRAGFNPGIFHIMHARDEREALNMSLWQLRMGKADILMKGLVGTDGFLRAVLDKELGLMREARVMSYVCALEIPACEKLLFVTDTAVIPFPDLNQKLAMLNYAVDMAGKFGIDRPRVALVSATEKPGPGLPQTEIDAILCKMADRGQIRNCVVDGPLDIFLACNPESLAVKGVESPLGGGADVLVFPSLEASNAFYKGLVLFAGAELAGMVMGTEKPVVVMSRSESELSKYYCICLACLMAQ